MEAKAEETLKPSEAGLRERTPTDIRNSALTSNIRMHVDRAGVVVCQLCAYSATQGFPSMDETRVPK